MIVMKGKMTMNKFGKSKIIGIAAASLAAVAVASVGFSAWVATTRDTTNTDVLKVVVEDVKEDSVKLSKATIIYPDGADSIRFDAVEGGTILKASQGAKEQLSFGISLEYEISADASFTGVSAWMEVSSSVDGAVAHVGDKEDTDTSKYILSPIKLGPTGSESNTLTEISAFSATNLKEKNTATTARNAFSFSWGKAFGGENPSKLTNKDNLTKYKENLTALKNAQYEFTVHLSIVG